MNLAEKTEKTKHIEITVKICGLKSEKDVLICQKYGADILGFVVDYPLPVPWNLSLEEAGVLFAAAAAGTGTEVAARTGASAETSASTGAAALARTCLVTGGDTDKIIALAEKLRPSYLQLHYRETLAETERLAAYLKALGLDIQIIKTLPLSSEERYYQFGSHSLEYAVRRLCETDIFGVLIDSRTPEDPASPGKKVDLDAFLAVKRLSSKPVILAGGITPDSVAGILERSGAEFIDVMTGVERSRGVKDEMKVRDLLGKVRYRITPPAKPDSR